MRNIQLAYTLKGVSGKVDLGKSVYVSAQIVYHYQVS